VLNPAGGIVRIEGKYLTHTSTIFRMQVNGAEQLIDLQYPDLKYIQTSQLLMSWYERTKYTATVMPVLVTRANYGVNFRLPDGRVVFVRCILPPPSK
jgi:hypothetical protein